MTVTGQLTSSDFAKRLQAAKDELRVPGAVFLSDLLPLPSLFGTIELAYEFGDLHPRRYVLDQLRGPLRRLAVCELPFRGIPASALSDETYPEHAILTTERHRILCDLSMKYLCGRNAGDAAAGRYGVIRSEAHEVFDLFDRLNALRGGVSTTTAATAIHASAATVADLAIVAPSRPASDHGNAHQAVEEIATTVKQRQGLDASKRERWTRDELAALVAAVDAVTKRLGTKRGRFAAVAKDWPESLKRRPNCTAKTVAEQYRKAVDAGISAEHASGSAAIAVAAGLLAT